MAGKEREEVIQVKSAFSMLKLVARGRLGRSMRRVARTLSKSYLAHR